MVVRLPHRLLGSLICTLGLPDPPYREEPDLDGTCDRGGIRDLGEPRDLVGGLCDVGGFCDLEPDCE